jgi:hypothetical protein
MKPNTTPAKNSRGQFTNFIVSIDRFKGHD